MNQDSIGRGTAVFTIVAKNYLPQARVLMRSIAACHPDWRRYVFLADRIDGYFDPAKEDFEVLLSSDLAIPQSRWFHFKYSILELSTAVKPYAFERLFSLGFESAVYLDPDIKVYSPMKLVTGALVSSSIVLTPHLTRPLDDAKRPAEIDILRSGSYNLGFIALARGGETREFLEWWQQKLFDHCVVDLARGLFVDQKWIDLVPGLFAGTHILRDPGYNVAYWNLPHRLISGSNGAYEVGDAPLAFFHFSGYDATRPEVLSRHQDRLQFGALSSATQEILLQYRDALLAAGYGECHEWPYAYGSFRNGVKIPDLGRPIHHEAQELVQAIDDPFSDEGYEAFLDVWNSPIEQSDGDHTGISRLAYRIYRTRSDVQAEMPDIFGGNYRRFLEWMLVSGKAEHGLGEAFLRSVSDALRTCKDWREGAAFPRIPGADSTEIDRLTANASTAKPDAETGLTRLAAAIYRSRPELQNFFPDPRGRDRIRFLVWLMTYGRKEHSLSSRHMEPIWREWDAILASLPGPLPRLRYRGVLLGMASSVYLRGIASRVSMRLANARIRKVAPAPPLPVQHVRRSADAMAGRAPDSGVNLVGYFRSETGVGQSARTAYAALQSVAVPTSLYCIGDTGPSRQKDASIGPMSAEHPYFINLFHVNADQTLPVRTGLGHEFYRHRSNIGYWAWELEDFPDRWASAFDTYREIWTPSSFCRDAIARAGRIPVFRIPHAIAPYTGDATLTRAHFGLPEVRFLFLAAFDALSIMERKNPLAAIRAFERAFGGASNCELIVKVSHAAAVPGCMDILRAAISSKSVRILDANVSREEMYSLIRSVDCFVSLHRSEGFGMVIAEAMYFGKPVIVTNYSGNTDFTTADNSLLVNYKLTEVGPNCEPYDAACHWADPDIDHAARHMAALVANPELRKMLSSKAREHIRAALSPEAVGRIMRGRLEALRQSAKAAKV